MKLEDTKLNCQISHLKKLSEGIAQVPAESISRRTKLMVRRILSPGLERKYKNYMNDLMNLFCKLTGRKTKPTVLISKNISESLRAGDWVRVRPLQEILSMGNHWKQVKGCAFMPEMSKFCGTTHRVLKAMERFVDERDLLIKKTRGIILLEGVMCEGTHDFGRCDRSCFHFWRKEWLEKIERPTISKPNISDIKVQSNHWVRVRSLKEIKATLNHGNEVQGCVFMPEMARYCGTKQRILKRMHRFVDERELRVKKSSDVVLLDGVTCQGKADFGSCDRSCFYLWREDWLETCNDIL